MREPVFVRPGTGVELPGVTSSSFPAAEETMLLSTDRAVMVFGEHFVTKRFEAPVGKRIFVGSGTEVELT